MKALKIDFSLAGALRVLGAVAVIGSGIIYMLQGLDTIDIQLRNWAYLVLMLVLSLGGVFSYSLLEDRKGARLFFALAALVIPVQFSQLGGMIFNYIGGGVGNLYEVFQFTGVSSELLFTTGSLSLLGAVIASFASFSILARPHARWLMLAFIVSNLFLLVPLRALPLGLLVLAAMLAIVFQLERKVFSRDVVFKTFEGFSTRVLCSLPLVIAFVRSAFHQNEYAGLCVLVALFAIVMTQLCVRWISKGALKEALIFAAWIIGGVSGVGISVYAIDHLGFNPDIAGLANPALLIVPFVAWTSYIAWISDSFAGIYRAIAMATTGLFTLMALGEKSTAGMLTAGVLGTGIIVWGYIERARLPIIIGALVVAGSLFGLVLIAVNQVDVNVWLALAVSGVVLVALSSVAEKYGRRWFNQGKESMEEFSNWPA